MPLSLPRWALPLVLSLFVPGTAAQTYSLVDDYTPDNWFDQFNFFTDGDPTNGHVQYVNETWATQNGLVSHSDTVYMGVDHTNTYSETGPGRPSVRLESKKVYNHGLFILDLNHMPIGCGTWPAWWTLGKSAEWPSGGEIDIIEGVNNNLNNTNKIYTGTGCSITGQGQTAIADSFNCADGCGSASTRTDSYGNGFNKADGGVYAMEWTSQWIRIWFFPRSSVPDSISKGSPDVSEFGTPTANFQGGCDVDEHFKDHTIIFDITFCGDWAGPTFGRYAGCPMTDSNAWTSCNNFVASSPESFKDAYWDINSMQVFQRGSEPVPADHSSVSISDAVRLSSTLGVPLGKSRSAAASVKSSLATISSAINFAEGADQQTSATPTTPGAISTPRRHRPRPSYHSSRPSSNGGDNGDLDSSPANAAFRTASPQPPCALIGGYDGTGQIGYRHGIGAINGGLAMCQGDCAETSRCTAVLYAHFESDFGSPLGYWDCWWGALDVGSVICDATSGSSGRDGKLAHRRAHSQRKILAKRQGVDMSPSPNIGVRDQDFQIFMVRGEGDVMSFSSSDGFSFSSTEPSTTSGFQISSSSSPTFVFTDLFSSETAPSTTSEFPVDSSSFSSFVFSDFFSSSGELSTASAFPTRGSSSAGLSTAQGFPISSSSSFPTFVFPDSSFSSSSDPLASSLPPPFVPDLMPDGAQSSVVTPTIITDDVSPTTIPLLPAFSEQSLTPSTSSVNTLGADPRPALTASSDAAAALFSSLSSSLSDSISSSLSLQLFFSSQTGSDSSSSTIPESDFSLARGAITSLLRQPPVFTSRGEPSSLFDPFSPPTPSRSRDRVTDDDDNNDGHFFHSNTAGGRRPAMWTRTVTVTVTMTRHVGPDGRLREPGATRTRRATAAAVPGEF